MKVLVTGATGCLGRNLVRRLIELGNEVYATGRNHNIGNDLEKLGAKFQKAALEDEQAINELCREKVIVFHCGALSSPWGKYRDFYNANVIGTNNIAKGCLKNNVKRLIYVSTPSIYFDFTDKHMITEDSTLPTKPVNHYVATKLEAEKNLDKFYENDGLPVVSIRPRAIFGPYDTTIMPRLLQAATKRTFLLVNGGKALVDVTYVDNVIDSLILCANANDSILGKKYNITNDEPTLLRDLLSQLFNALGLIPEYKTVSYKRAYFLASILESIHSLPFVAKEPRLTKYGVGVLGFGQTLDISAAKQDLGYRPSINLEEGIELFAKWWVENNGAN